MAKHDGLVARIQAEASAELNNLKRLQVELHKITDGDKNTDSIILRAKASILADFYNGIERTLKIILSELDGGLPKGDDWHRQLLTNAKISTSLRSSMTHIKRQNSCFDLSFQPFNYPYYVRGRCKNRKPLKRIPKNPFDV